MHGLPALDGHLVIDWGKTSADYSVYRPGPPPGFYDRLASLGIGLPGQWILDLGTGTGVLARQFARQGAHASGIDISHEQIETARRCAAKEKLAVEFLVGHAESLPWTTGIFDVATASQCWLYFDKPKVIAELRRVLKPGGWLVTSHLSWLPRLDPIARESERLVLQFNPHWSAADWSGEIPDCPDWAAPYFNVRAKFVDDEPIRFTRESWRGRIRACRGIGATLPPEKVAAFDAAHDELLKRIAPENFTILHRIDAHVFEFKGRPSRE
jgi:SAM-dependent methyltransferase